MFLCLFIILLVRFWLLSGHLLGNSCTLGWPFILIVFCLFVFYIFPILFLRASAITMPELVEINLVLDDEQLVDRQKMKFVLTLLRFFSLRNEIVKVI